MVTFFKEVWAELFKVVWPSRKDTIRLTIIVIIFSILTAAFLGAVDYGLLKGIQAIINK